MFAPRMRRGPIHAVLAVLIALVPTATARAQLPVTADSAPDACPGATAAPGTMPAPAARSAVLCLLNLQRAASGLPALHESAPLRHAATRFADAMVRGRFFDHVSPGGSTLRQRVAGTAYLRHTRSWTLGENIAYGSDPLAAPASIVAAWMESSLHRANILTRSFRDIGIGIAAGLPVDGTGAT